MKPCVFRVKRSIESFGVWYALWAYGLRNIWTIWVATRMTEYDTIAQRAHADHHYGNL